MCFDFGMNKYHWMILHPWEKQLTFVISVAVSAKRDVEAFKVGTFYKKDYI